MEGYEFRPAKLEEFDQVKLAIARSFSNDPEHAPIPEFVLQFETIPLESDKYIWGVFFEDHPVAGAILIPFTFQLGTATFQVIGLTGVGTIPEYRRKGLSLHLLQEIHAFAQQTGFDGAILHSGADQLYLKAGYEFAFCQWIGNLIHTDGLMEQINEKIMDGTTQNEYDGYFVDFVKSNEDLELYLADLHRIRKESPCFNDRHFRTFRSSYYFRNKLREKINQGHFLAILNRKKNSVAYALGQLKANKMILYEWYSCSRDLSEFYLLFSKILEEFWENRARVEFFCYYEDSEIHQLIKSLGGSIDKGMMPKNMVTLFDPIVSFHKILPTLSLRWGSRIKFETEIKEFIFFIEAVPIHFRLLESYVIIDKNSEPSLLVPTLRFSDHEWLALFFGYLEAEDLSIEDQSDYEVLEDILNILFPPLNPVWDYFQTY